MKSPYASLLAVRRIEEKQAEALLAECQREVAGNEEALASARDGRDAWVNEYLDRPVGDRSMDGLAQLVARIEQVEREVQRRLEAAEHRAEAAREALLERRRQREAVERLHLEAVAAAARALARRLQAELDDLAGLTAHARGVGIAGNSY